MIFLSASEFGIDQIISSIAAMATFSAVIVALYSLKANFEKEKREAQVRSKKTLSMMDFILEDNNVKVIRHIKRIKSIKTELRQKHAMRIIEKKKENIFPYDPPTGPFDFEVEYDEMGIDLPDSDPQVETEVEKIYIILALFQILKTEKFLDELKIYQQELKENLRNQHLNITSNSLEKISNKIDGLKECKEILDSIRIRELLYIAHCEKTAKKKTNYTRIEIEDKISKALKKNMYDFIEEDYKKISELEEALQEVIKPLNSEMIK